MKKISLVAVLSLFFSFVVYGVDYWYTDNPNSIRTTASYGYVGIGCGAAGYRLNVNGTLQTKGFKLPTGKHNGYVLTSNSSGTGTWKAIPQIWSKNGSNVYYNDGNVGIGTNQPSRLLDLCNDDRKQIEFDRTENSSISNLFYIGS